jgi:hypothetical protein
MKKVILCISALLLIASVGIAQVNMSDVNQVGNLEVSIVNQHGSSNTSDVNQLGNRNKSEMYQGIKTRSFDSKRNSAVVIQDGNGNTAFAGQGRVENHSFQCQKPPSIIVNTSNHYQYETKNNATTTQNGSMLLDNTMQIGKFSTVTVTQTGNGHESVAYSNVKNNAITVTQNIGM